VNDGMIIGGKARGSRESNSNSKQVLSERCGGEMNSMVCTSESFDLDPEYKRERIEFCSVIAEDVVVLRDHEVVGVRKGRDFHFPVFTNQQTNVQLNTRYSDTKIDSIYMGIGTEEAALTPAGRRTQRMSEFVLDCSRSSALYGYGSSRI